MKLVRHEIVILDRQRDAIRQIEPDVNSFIRAAIDVRLIRMQTAQKLAEPQVFEKPKLKVMSQKQSGSQRPYLPHPDRRKAVPDRRKALAP